MKEIKLNDDAEFREKSQALLDCQLELVKVTARIAEVELEILNVKPTQHDDEWGELLAGGASGTIGTTQLNGLREEQSYLVERERFLTRAVQQGSAVLDTIRGKLSLHICKVRRPEFAADAKAILGHLKNICEIEQQSRRRRADLEKDGVVTGSIPYLLFDIGGPWDDEFGGKVAAYRQWIETNYELS